MAASARLWSLSEHLTDYEQLMMQYYGAGIQACYRGPRLYNTDVTKQTVSRVLNWYKKYRPILNSDLIHLRRADGRDWDGFLHVNPTLPKKAEGKATVYRLNRNYEVELPIDIEPASYGWWVIE